MTEGSLKMKTVIKSRTR